MRAGQPPSGECALSLDEFGELLSRIYCAPVEPRGWLHCLEALRSHFAARTVTLFIRLASESDPGLMLTAAKAFPNELRAGHSRVAAGSPLTALAPDRVTAHPDRVPDDEWRASRFYREQCRPFGVFHFMGANIRVRTGAVYPFWLGRSERDGAFTEDQRAVCAQLLPHLRRALELQLDIERDRSLGRLYGQAVADLMIGIIVLDDRGRVRERNAVADGILRLKDGLRLVGERLEVASRQDDARLQQMIRGQLSGEPPSFVPAAISVARPSGRSSWSVLAQPIGRDEWSGIDRPAVALFVRDVEGSTNPHAELVQQLFGFTKREALLVIHLANGVPIEDAAHTLGIQLTTARAHLRAIFTKIGVRRQSDLVRIILNSVALLGRSDRRSA